MQCSTLRYNNRQSCGFLDYTKFKILALGHRFDHNGRGDACHRLEGEHEVRLYKLNQTMIMAKSCDIRSVETCYARFGPPDDDLFLLQRRVTVNGKLKIADQDSRYQKERQR